MSDGGAPESSTLPVQAASSLRLFRKLGLVYCGTEWERGRGRMHQCKKRYCKMASLGWIAKQRKSGESAESALGLRRESGGTEKKMSGSARSKPRTGLVPCS